MANLIKARHEFNNDTRHGWFIESSGRVVSLGPTSEFHARLTPKHWKQFALPTLIKYKLLGVEIEIPEEP